MWSFLVTSQIPHSRWLVLLQEQQGSLESGLPSARARCLASCWLLAGGWWSHFVPYHLRYTIVTSLESLHHPILLLCRLEIDLFVSMRYLHDLHVICICAKLTHAYISDVCIYIYGWYSVSRPC